MPVRSTIARPDDERSVRRGASSFCGRTFAGQAGSSKRSAAWLSGEKLGKLVSDLSLGATLLEELLGWLRRFRLRGALRVVLRLLRLLWCERREVVLCWETERWRGDEEDDSAASMAVAVAMAAKVRP